MDAAIGWNRDPVECGKATGGSVNIEPDGGIDRKSDDYPEDRKERAGSQFHTAELIANIIADQQDGGDADNYFNDGNGGFQRRQG
jgi:hypothetical protein